MRSVQVREAKASLSALIEEAAHGVPTTITRHGVPTAMLVPFADAEKIYAHRRSSLVDYLREMPDGGIEFERDDTAMRDVEL